MLKSPIAFMPVAQQQRGGAAEDEGDIDEMTMKYLAPEVLPGKAAEG